MEEIESETGLTATFDHVRHLETLEMFASNLMQ